MCLKKYGDLVALWQGRSKRKPTGGRLKSHRKKRKYEIGTEKQETSIGKPRYKIARTKGGNHKIRALSAQKANVMDPSEKITKSVRITSVIENPANPHFVRRNIITKGAIIHTEIGKARVTSRPGQHGIINAVLIEK